MSSISSTDRARFGGYRMPAEWEPHLATYLVWPHNPDTWPGKFELIPRAYARMAASIAMFEPVRLLVKDREQGEIARSMTYDAAKELGPIKGVEILTIPTNDSW
ncbi:MAG TPA: agmatine deiminase family protein, partial [Candidatus Binataceae bacterium]|nr:agmatine deiminase family protein [Candidatus Binataceae bacterium]